MLTRSFYLLAIFGLSLLLMNFIIGAWTVFNLSPSDYQKWYRQYAFIEMAIISFNLTTISWYCYKKMFWTALLSFILIDCYNLMNVIDIYFYFSYSEPLIVEDTTVIKYMTLLVPAIHFILIGLSIARKMKWLMFYAISGLIFHFTISVVKSKGFWTIYELFCYVSCFTTVLIILNYLDEIKILKRKESDHILDMD